MEQQGAAVWYFAYLDYKTKNTSMSRRLQKTIAYLLRNVRILTDLYGGPAPYGCSVFPAAKYGWGGRL